ncbi:ParA family protein [Kocuria palustris]|uniref:ParA family protein n=1 Tax=Kocuria palustris TaxID=71999 RepID=UPI00119D49DC|nr:ParA family protein [Kocuria palustris]
MQIVSVSSLKGGVGKTSVALGLASAAMHDGHRALVVDMDPHADATTGLGAEARAGADVGSVLDGRVARSAARRAVVPSAWIERERAAQRDAGGAEGAPRLDVLPGSSTSSRLDRSTFRGKDLDRLSRALDGLDPDYDLVLVDCPPNLSALTRMAWAASDKVLTVAEPSLFSVAGAQRTMTAIGQFEASSKRAVPSASVVVDKVVEDDAEHQHRVRELQELFGPLLVEQVIPDRAVWHRAQGAAWPIHRWPGAQAADMAGRFTTILRGLLD